METQQFEEKRYAGFWLRFLASVLDGFILGIPLMILQSIINAVVYVPRFTQYFNDFNVMMMDGYVEEDVLLGFYQLQLEMIIVSFLINLVACVLYYAGLEGSKLQGTLGKKICGIKVVDSEGERISYFRAVGRFFGKYLSFITLMVGYIMAGVREDKRALHDLVAKTYVLKK